MVDRSGAFGIEESFVSGNVYGGAYSRDAEFDDVFGGQRRMDFDYAIVRSEILFVHSEPIPTEREIADEDETRVVGGEGAVDLGGIAGEIDGGFDSLLVGSVNFEAEFSGVALGLDAERKQ